MHPTDYHWAHEGDEEIALTFDIYVDTANDIEVDIDKVQGTIRAGRKGETPSIEGKFLNSIIDSNTSHDKPGNGKNNKITVTIQIYTKLSDGRWNILINEPRVENDFSTIDCCSLYKLYQTNNKGEHLQICVDREYAPALLHYAKSLFEEEKFALAFKHFKKLYSNTRLDEAAYYIGLSYEFGKGVVPSSEKALSFYNEAIKDEHALAYLRKGKIKEANNELEIASYYYNLSLKRSIKENDKQLARDALRLIKKKIKQKNDKTNQLKKEKDYQVISSNKFTYWSTLFLFVTGSSISLFALFAAFFR